MGALYLIPLYTSIATRLPCSTLLRAAIKMTDDDGRMNGHGFSTIFVAGGEPPARREAARAAPSL